MSTYTTPDAEQMLQFDLANHILGVSYRFLSSVPERRTRLKHGFHSGTPLQVKRQVGYGYPRGLLHDEL